VVVSVVATLLKQVPAAAKFKARLLALEGELTRLRAENTALRDELERYLEQWETLDGPQVSALQYLAANAQGHAAEIAKAAAINVQIADSSLNFLASHRYVQPAQAAARSRVARYTLAARGERYLRERGLYK
jgi:hypothetical protein